MDGVIDKCAELRRQREALIAERVLLQEELRTAPPGDKPAIIAQIKEITRQLAQIAGQLFPIPPSEVALNITECIFGWQAAYRIEHDTAACTLRVTVRIRLEPDDDVTADELANLRAIWEPGIQQRWSRQFGIVRTGNGLCRCPHYLVTFDVRFVDAGEHHRVRVRRGPARSNMTTWDTEDSAGTVAHEFGHMLSFPDEYADPACPNRTVTSDGSIMQTTAGAPRQRHYVPFSSWITRRTCCGYRVGT